MHWEFSSWFCYWSYFKKPVMQYFTAFLEAVLFSSWKTEWKGEMIMYYVSKQEESLYRKQISGRKTRNEVPLKEHYPEIQIMIFVISVIVCQMFKIILNEWPAYINQGVFFAKKLGKQQLCNFVQQVSETLQYSILTFVF